jgi:hypothetical protein
MLAEPGDVNCVALAEFLGEAYGLAVGLLAFSSVGADRLAVSLRRQAERL